jgi:NADH:ubiquinone oxidoreductase subunit 2 (subunit N)
LLWLVLLALVTSVVSFYYYLKILKQVYVAEPASGAAGVREPVTTRIAVWAAAALVVIFGCLPDLLLNRIAAAASAAFH